MLKIESIFTAYANILIWILFAFGFGVFLIGSLIYGLETRNLRVVEHPLHYVYPLFDGYSRIFLHGLTSIIFRLFKMPTHKKLRIYIHSILGILAFVGTIFARNFEILTFKMWIFVNISQEFSQKLNYPILWLITLILEIFYVSKF